MVDRSEFNTLSKAALTAVVAGSLFGLPTLPADASINSQVKEIDSDKHKHTTKMSTLLSLSLSLCVCVCVPPCVCLCICLNMSVCLTVNFDVSMMAQNVCKRVCI